ncbi:hypothetical protein ACFVW8_04595 [Streptomyces sp. NPDC058221]|uniref:hypothetical protein n=1 Tax=Streptomyces sp. NPDC058221 TaxID=3346388 RepID=UPI0036E7D34B
MAAIPEGAQRPAQRSGPVLDRVGVCTALVVVGARRADRAAPRRQRPPVPTGSAPVP